MSSKEEFYCTSAFIELYWTELNLIAAEKVTSKPEIPDEETSTVKMIRCVKRHVHPKHILRCFDNF